jgi:hypothetical protein
MGIHWCFLLLGGFLLSKAMEKSGAHRRIALLLVHACPKGDKFLLLGFMLSHCPFEHVDIKYRLHSDDATDRPGSDSGNHNNR